MFSVSLLSLEILINELQNFKNLHFTLRNFLEIFIIVRNTYFKNQKSSKWSFYTKCVYEKQSDSFICEENTHRLLYFDGRKQGSVSENEPTCVKLSFSNSICTSCTVENLKSVTFKRNLAVIHYEQ